MSVAIFVPVYNDEKTLGPIFGQIPEKINSHEVTLFVVDDGSSDRSSEIARKFTSHVIEHGANKGVGAATKTGLMAISDFSHFDFVIKFDADGQHRVDLLPEVVKRLELNDIVICSRFHPLSDQTHTPLDRILLNMIFTEMLRKITGWKLTDVRSGYMGFHFKDIRAIASRIIVPRYGIPMELLLRVWDCKGRRLNTPISEIPHAAFYGGDISEKLKKKYSAERIDHKASRLQMAYEALLMVVEDLKIPREAILAMNGFKVPL